MITVSSFSIASHAILVSADLLGWLRWEGHVDWNGFLALGHPRGPSISGSATHRLCLRSRRTSFSCTRYSSRLRFSAPKAETAGPRGWCSGHRHRLPSGTAAVHTPTLLFRRLSVPAGEWGGEGEVGWPVTLERRIRTDLEEHLPKRISMLALHFFT